MAAELEGWVDRLVLESDRATSPRSALVNRRELYDVHRQLKALHDTFPQAFQ